MVCHGERVLTVMALIGRSRRLRWALPWLGVLVWLAWAPLALAEPAVGDWSGVLRPPGGFLRLNLFISRGPGGALQGYLVSLDQGAANFAFDKVEATPETLHLEARRQGAVFDARWNGDLQVWQGVWRQGGRNTPLALRRGTLELPVRAPRPQRPLPPFPYRQEEVRFQSAGASLAGTLTLPEGEGPFPAVVLIAGSGPHTRNERILDHQPFLVLADDLTRRGVAVLRYDKRGVGGSIGDYHAATTRDFADDAEAALALLRARRDIDARKIGLVGHSEGAMIAPMIAAEDPKVAFLALLAPPAVTGEAILLEQDRLIRIASGQDPVQARASAQGQRRLYDLIVAGADARQLRAAQGLPPGLEATDQPSSLLNQLPWMKYFLAYDPAPALRQLRIPVLALVGSKDLQVPPELDLAPLKAALAGDAEAKVVELPGLNHLFQTAATGSPAEYGRIEETFAPVALQALGDWIAGQVR
jgi:pimeloyl-ACP methyl ester carboxylesterase